MSVHPDAAFIVLEGIDGSGTTTQCQLLGEELRRRLGGREVLVTREPYDNVLTRRIREWLKDDDLPHEALLLAFCLDRQIHLREVVEPALRRGAIVVCDRYKLSTLVYQTKNNDEETVYDLCDSSRDPDLYVLLDVDAETAAARMASRSATKDAYERNLDFQRMLAEDYRDRLLEETDDNDACFGTIIDGNDKTILQTHEAIIETVWENLDLG